MLCFNHSVWLSCILGTLFKCFWVVGKWSIWICRFCSSSTYGQPTLNSPTTTSEAVAIAVGQWSSTWEFLLSFPRSVQRNSLFRFVLLWWSQQQNTFKKFSQSNKNGRSQRDTSHWWLLMGKLACYLRIFRDWTEAIRSWRHIFLFRGNFRSKQNSALLYWDQRFNNPREVIFRG